MTREEKINAVCEILSRKLEVRQPTDKLLLVMPATIWDPKVRELAESIVDRIEPSEL